MRGYDNTKENTFIMYFDANNLYGWVMTQCLPYGSFKWMTKKEINDFNLGLIGENGYILEVGLEYPSELHDLHNDYSLFYDVTNKKVAGKMKDEISGKVFSEFIGLKSKMYSLISVDDKEKMRAKGVNEKLKHSEFVDVLFNKKVIRHNMKRLQSKLHRLGTYDVFKVSLSCFDDKRYVLDDGINTLAYFHKDNGSIHVCQSLLMIINYYW